MSCSFDVNAGNGVSWIVPIQAQSEPLYYNVFGVALEDLQDHQMFQNLPVVFLHLVEAMEVSFRSPVDQHFNPFWDPFFIDFGTILGPKMEPTSTQKCYPH